jgi:hypothetical protein
VLGACGSETSTPTPTPSPTPTVVPSTPAAPTPTPTATAPPGFFIVESQLTDLPAFVVGTSVNRQPGLETDFPYLTAWAECITHSTGQPASDVAECRVRSLRLIERRRSDGVESVVAATGFALDRGQPLRCDLSTAEPRSYIAGGICRGALYRRRRGDVLCWYGWCADADGGHDGVAPMQNGIVGSDDVLRIDIARTPRQVAHWWTFVETPIGRPLAKPLAQFDYLIEIDFQTRGKAALRVGLDRWTAGGALKPCALVSGSQEKCEAFRGNWYATEDAADQRLRLPAQ